ncbi:hypothetical protein [Sphingobium sp. D43FB]|uniref:hypothetical protein n=1 Tax=Sphingobium sp. D43FB TaxID=2017595 RepID=UPI000BB56566|nr:hypothetical protein [Sphingobium sp. D43FB]PBN42115.1 hypothetical protein SxD43FB_18360 [Sphingobium sp. D43FB]|tara:strand:- start:281 stop:508 length:228 start_codon:yes stop_codon:yes gene_type:complete
MSDILFTVFFAIVGCLMATRLYLLVTKGELNVKGVIYSKGETPVAYGATTIFASIGMLFSFLMAAIGIVTIFQGP